MTLGRCPLSIFCSRGSPPLPVDTLTGVRDALIEALSTTLRLLIGFYYSMFTAGCLLLDVYHWMFTTGCLPQAFEKLRSIMPDSADCIWNIATICDELDAFYASVRFRGSGFGILGLGFSRKKTTQRGKDAFDSHADRRSRSFDRSFVY